MKTIFKSAMFAAALFVAAQTQAKTMGSDTSKVSKAAKSVGHKTSEIAAKGAAAVVDKKYAGKYGPQRQSIYIDKYSHYYYINHLGHKVYLKKSELRDR